MKNKIDEEQIRSDFNIMLKLDSMANRMSLEALRLELLGLIKKNTDIESAIVSNLKDVKKLVEISMIMSLSAIIISLLVLFMK